VPEAVSQENNAYVTGHQAQEVATKTLYLPVRCSPKAQGLRGAHVNARARKTRL